jgi:transposase
MGKREGEQEDLFVTHQQLRSQSHPFHRAVNRVLADEGFDRYVQGLCSKFYAKKMGRPGLAPGIYFRSLLLGFFEGIDSERGIAWRAAEWSGVSLAAHKKMTGFPGPGDTLRGRYP